MLMIRLARFGAKKKPFYRVVVIEKERARNGRHLEVVGHYNPLTTPAQVDLKHDRMEHWTKNGAQMSDTVKRLVEKNPRPAAETPAAAPAESKPSGTAPNCNESAIPFLAVGRLAPRRLSCLAYHEVRGGRGDEAVSRGYCESSR